MAPKEYAVGRNTAAAWEVGEADKVRQVWTDTMPIAEVERVAPNEDRPLTGAVTFGMEDLAALAAGNGSNRELKATACRDRRRETPKPWRREAVWGRSRRHAAAPNESEALDRPGRSGERAKERNARNPTEIGAVLRPGAAVHSVSLPWEICMGPRER